MHIVFILDRPLGCWGGDLQVLKALQSGVQELGGDWRISIVPSVFALKEKADFAFLSGLHARLYESALFLDHQKIPWGWVPFYEDYTAPFCLSLGIHGLLEFLSKQPIGVRNWIIELLKEKPNLLRSHQGLPKSRLAVVDLFAMNRAKLSIHSSNLEKNLFVQDFWESNPFKLFWPVIYPRSFDEKAFLQLTGLGSKSYLLQVGRLESRKNNILTLLATEDVDIPLVFLASGSNQTEYKDLFLKYAQRSRKADVYLVSPMVRTLSVGKVHLIHASKQMMDTGLIHSAFTHCALHVLPSYYELPGLVHFEAWHAGARAVVGEWGCWQEYVEYGREGPLPPHGLHPVKPLDIGGIRQAILDNVGKPPPSTESFPIFERKPKDFAADFFKVMHTVLDYSAASPF